MQYGHRLCSVSTGAEEHMRPTAVIKLRPQLHWCRLLMRRRVPAPRRCRARQRCGPRVLLLGRR